MTDLSRVQYGKTLWIVYMRCLSAFVHLFQKLLDAVILSHIAMSKAS